MAEPELWDEFSERLRDLETAEFAPEIISPFLALPGLRGFWPLGAVGTAGEARDLGGSGATYDLTNNNVATFGYDGLAPYCEYDGVNQYHSFVDNANFDILGTETYVVAAYRGLTLGGWFYNFGNDVALDRIYGKGATTGNQRAYSLYLGGAALVAFGISSTGADFFSSGAVAFTANAWTFVAGRFIPSTEIKVWGNENTSTLAAGIPAALWNSNVGFAIGAQGDGTLPVNMRASLCWLCAEQLSDGIILSLFQQTRGAFGV